MRVPGLVHLPSIRRLLVVHISTRMHQLPLPVGQGHKPSHLTSLNLLDACLYPGKERVALLETSQLDRHRFRIVLLHDLGQLERLVVSLHVLEAECLLNSTKQVIDLFVGFSKVGSGTDKTFLARELAERCPTDTFDVVLEDGVRDALDLVAPTSARVFERSAVFERTVF